MPRRGDLRLGIARDCCSKVNFKGGEADMDGTDPREPAPGRTLAVILQVEHKGWDFKQG